MYWKIFWFEYGLVFKGIWIKIWFEYYQLRIVLNTLMQIAFPCSYATTLLYKGFIIFGPGSFELVTYQRVISDWTKRNNILIPKKVWGSMPIWLFGQLVKADRSCVGRSGFYFCKSLKLFSVYSMDVMIIAPMTVLTFNRLQKSDGKM